MALQVKKANPNKPFRILAYGGEGVGKTTLAAGAKKPLFFSLEEGADHVKNRDGESVDEVQNINNFASLRSSLKDLIKDRMGYETLVIDSIDEVEKMAHAQILGNSGKSIATVNGGYGAGFRQSQSLHKEFIDDLSDLRNAGMNIILIGHDQVRKVKDPEVLGDYDAFEINCHEYVSALWRGWVDAIFFIRFKTYLANSDDTDRARAMSDGSRVMYARKQPFFQAKNRYGIPSELDFTENIWETLDTYFHKGAVVESLEEILDDVMELKTHITDENTLKLVNDTIEKNKNDKSGLLATRARLRELTGKEN